MYNGRYSNCSGLHRLTLAVLGVALPASSAFLPGCRGADGDKTPKADFILDKYVEVTGGKAAYGRIRNRHIQAAAEYVGENVTMDMTIYEALPGKRYVLTVTKPFGTIEEGVHGEVAWAISPLSGNRIKEGDQRDWDLRRAFFHPHLEWRKFYKQAKFLGIVPVNGKPCYKILATPHVGAPETRFYDTESYLLVKKETTAIRPNKEELYETFFEDYREVDGVLIPHKWTQTRDGEQKLEYIITSIQHNVEIPPGRLDLPDEIQTMLDNPEMQEKKKREPGERRIPIKIEGPKKDEPDK